MFLALPNGSILHPYSRLLCFHFPFLYLHLVAVLASKFLTAVFWPGPCPILANDPRLLASTSLGKVQREREWAHMPGYGGRGGWTHTTVWTTPGETAYKKICPSLLYTEAHPEVRCREGQREDQREGKNEWLDTKGLSWVCPTFRGWAVLGVLKSVKQDILLHLI